MSEHEFPPWYTEKVEPFLKSIWIVLVFLPWLVLGYWIVVNRIPELHQNDRDVLFGFIEWFGTAYSFFLALAIVNVWSQFETVERELDRELDAVSTLLETVKYTQTSGVWNTQLVEEFKEQVIGDIKNYLDHVIKNHKYECLVPDQRREGYKILKRIGMQISTLTKNRTVPEPFINELFQSLNEATDVRGDRIAHSKPYAPVLVQVMAVVISLIWLFSFLGLVIYNQWIATILIGGVFFVIIMVLVIFFDLGEPFGGIWKINLDDWHEFRYNMDHDDDPEVIFLYQRNNQLGDAMSAWLGRSPCQLSSLAHSGSRFRRTLWKAFLEWVHQSRQTDPPNTIQYLECYADELEYYGVPDIVEERPLVVLSYKDERTVLLSNQDIQSCQNLTAFKTLFNQRLLDRIPWFGREIATENPA